MTVGQRDRGGSLAIASRQASGDAMTVSVLPGGLVPLFSFWTQKYEGCGWCSQ